MFQGKYGSKLEFPRGVQNKSILHSQAVRKFSETANFKIISLCEKTIFGFGFHFSLLDLTNLAR